MPADQAQVVSEYVAIQCVAELSAQGTAAGATDKRAEDGTGDGADSDAEWTGDGANGSAGLTACQCCADASSGTAHRADGGGDFPGLVERSDFGRVTARALQ